VSRLTVAPLAEYDPSGGRVKITAPYGDGRGHQGVDWGTTDGIEIGTTLYAPIDGYIEDTGYDGPYTPGHHTAGNWLWFRGDNGTRWKMFHLDSVTHPTGVHVAAGHPIARVGNSGTQAAHLHLEEHAGAWNMPIDFTADAHEVINAGRWPGQEGDWFAMATEEQLRAIVKDEINLALKNNFNGKRAIGTDGDSGLYELVINGNGHLVRRHIPHPDQIRMLEYVDYMAGDGTGRSRHIDDEAMRLQFLNLPTV
jgi:murein DD-endopeptidase MepM/ murein hydrolase activator NlpD